MTEGRQGWVSDFASAMQLLTRIPLGSLGQIPESSDQSQAVWAYPVAGAIVGVIGALVYAVADWAEAPNLVSAFLAIGGMVLATGALHEDGLADTADGFGGGQNIESKLTIMRDSRIGTYGMLAIIFSVGLRVGAVAALDSVALIAGALIAVGALSRATMPVLMTILDSARADGMSVRAGTPDARFMNAGLIIAAVIVLFAIPLGLAINAAIAAFAAILFWRWLAKKQSGGQTGDVLGALGQTVEITVLIVIASSV